jgi:hypothetical protein
MPLYRVCDLALESSVPLPELQRIEGGAADLKFYLPYAEDLEHIPAQWFHQWIFPDGETWMAFGKLGADYLLRFTDLADYLIRIEQREIRCYPKPGITMETIRHLLLDQVIPLVLSSQGKLVLHASAIATPDGAIAFIGSTGRGKSTLAASFTKRGLPLLTDDCLLIEDRDDGLFAKPSYQGLRLWPETVSALFEGEAHLDEVAHYTEKKRIGGDKNQLPFCDHPVRLKRAYLLAPVEEMETADSIIISPLPPREALMEMVQYTYRMDINDSDRLKQDFELLSRIATLPLFYRLTYPRDLALLNSVQEAILENTAAEPEFISADQRP